MSHTTRLRRNPGTFRQLTGMTPDVFDGLLAELEPLHRAAEVKRLNRRVSKRRIVVEHGIGKMKIWRIASERYRNRRRGHTLMMKNVAGLHNRMFG